MFAASALLAQPAVQPRAQSAAQKSGAAAARPASAQAQGQNSAQPQGAPRASGEMSAFGENFSPPPPRARAVAENRKRIAGPVLLRGRKPDAGYKGSRRAHGTGRHSRGGAAECEDKLFLKGKAAARRGGPCDKVSAERKRHGGSSAGRQIFQGVALAGGQRAGAGVHFGQSLRTSGEQRVRLEILRAPIRRHRHARPDPRDFRIPQQCGGSRALSAQQRLLPDGHRRQPPADRDATRKDRRRARHTRGNRVFHAEKRGRRRRQAKARVHTERLPQKISRQDEHRGRRPHQPAHSRHAEGQPQTYQENRGRPRHRRPAADAQRGILCPPRGIKGRGDRAKPDSQRAAVGGQEQQRGGAARVAATNPQQHDGKRPEPRRNKRRQGDGAAHEPHRRPDGRRAAIQRIRDNRSGREKQFHSRLRHLHRPHADKEHNRQGRRGSIAGENRRHNNRSHAVRQTGLRIVHFRARLLHSIEHLLRRRDNPARLARKHLRGLAERLGRKSLHILDKRAGILGSLQHRRGKQQGKNPLRAVDCHHPQQGGHHQRVAQISVHNGNHNLQHRQLPLNAGHRRVARPSA